MKNPSEQDLFELLDAGRALGDLSAEEEQEWRELAEKLGVKADPRMDSLVAALEMEYVKKETPPEHLIEKLREDAETFSTGGGKPWDRVVGSCGQLWDHPMAGWAIAAGFVVLLLLGSLLERPAVPDSLLAASDLVELEFQGQASYQSMSGKVLWSDEQQRGVLQLAGLPVNDPGQKQYQLWIVDPERDTHPVDGGVFDVSAEGQVSIPVRSKLVVDDPPVFVITLEQPGGVVVSKQDVVVAVASG